MKKHKQNLNLKAMKKDSKSNIGVCSITFYLRYSRIYLIYHKKHGKD